MSDCKFAHWVQSYYDRDLPPEAMDVFRDHLPGCGACAAELALFMRVAQAIAEAPTFEPDAALTERILDRVVPARIRRRWVLRLSWGYAATLAASAAVVVAVLAQPEWREALVRLWTGGSAGLARALVFSLDALAFTVVSLADGWGLISQFAQRLAPLARATTSILSQTTVWGALALALGACALLLWWMRPRSARAARGVHHVVLVP